MSDFRIECGCLVTQGLGGVHTLCPAHADLVLERIVAEREACAKIAADHADWLEHRGSHSCGEAVYIVEQVRARGKTT